MDVVLTQWINLQAGRSDILDAGMLAVTHYGVPLMMVFVTALWWLGSPVRPVRQACITAALSLCFGFALAQLMHVFNRPPGPVEAGISQLVVPTSENFFIRPAIASSGIAFAFLLRRVVPVWSAILVAMAFLVCFSRVYLGLRYASDVANGAGLGLIAAVLAHFTCRRDTAIDRWLVKWF